MKLGADLLRKIAGDLEGTCQSLTAVLERYEFEADEGEVEDQLLSLGLERCPHCEWWMESCELINDAGDVVGCDQCREAKTDDE